MRLPAADEVLVGRAVRLEPYDAADADELGAAIWNDKVFAGGFGGGVAARQGGTGFAEWFEGYRPRGEGARTYVVRLDGRAVGTSSLYRADFVNGGVCIGYTAYSPEVWGTPVNPDAKRTLLEVAFGGGAHRVVFEADNANSRSLAAIAKLGAQRDGVLREDRLRADGTWRSTVVFSILEQDWPGVRAGLDARLG
jgi:RimJ/RimL family protein N-acetyltransferase